MSGSLSSEQNLILKAAMMYRRDAQGYDELVKALNEYADDAARALRAAPNDSLPKAQGMALEAFKLAKLFSEAHTKATSIEKNINP